MENKKIVMIALLMAIVILAIIASSNSRLIDRVFYRLGFQEQVCFSELRESITTQNETNFVLGGDFGINENSEFILNKMKTVEPEIIILTGDLGQSTFEEWKEMTESMDLSNVYVTLGDAEENEFRQEYLDYHNLEKNYYSFDYENIHFLAVSTETRNNFSNDKIQIEFIENDLKSNMKNTSTDWTIVFMHHPMYSSIDVEKAYVEELRSELQPIFDLYDVNLVINGHKHAYERSVPLTYNSMEMGSASCVYEKYEGQIYITAGTGGHSHSPFTKKESWSVIQNDNDYGFLNMKLLNDGKILYLEFMTNNGKVMDSIKIYFDSIEG